MRAGLTPTPLPPKIEVILTSLDNPRGVVIGSSGEFFVAEAGTGYDAVDPTRNTMIFQGIPADDDTEPQVTGAVALDNTTVLVHLCDVR